MSDNFRFDDSDLRNLIHKTARAIWDKRRSSVPLWFNLGEDVLPVSGKIIFPEEFEYAILALSENVLTAGPWTTDFEHALAELVGVRHARMVNSGSSANLLALAALRYDDCREEGDIRPTLRRGNVVLTSMLAFPTTVNPIYQNELVPLFCDIDLGTYVPSLDTMLKVMAEHDADCADLGMAEVKAVMMAHTLGNPWPAAMLREVRPDLWLIEDNCDALGSVVRDRSGVRLTTGGVGDVSTQSFYPAHHITTGEGGAVLTNNGRLAAVVESLRDWGRACWCEPSKSNTCGKRFEWDFSPLPFGTDHKYVYNRIGYNLKSTDIQAAIGLAQLKHVAPFARKRGRNFDLLLTGLARDSDVFILPQATEGSIPNWFGFPLTLRHEVPVSRKALVDWLWEKKIDTRPIFAGSLLMQPAYRRSDLTCISLVQEDACPNARMVGERGFWVGVWPGLDLGAMCYIRDCLREAAAKIREKGTLE